MLMRTLTDGWTPLLEGRSRDQALHCARDIAAALVDYEARTTWKDEDLFLSGSRGGASLLFLELSALDGSSDGRETAGRFLMHDCRILARSSALPGLLGGLAGLGWLSHRADREGVVTALSCAEVDELLGGHVSQDEWEEDYELVFGLVGLGVYALSRGEEERARVLLDSVLRHIAGRAEDHGRGVAWQTLPSSWTNDETGTRADLQFDLGLAHGIPGVIALLAYAVLAGRGGAVCEGLLERSVRWLLDQRITGSAGSEFPYCISRSRTATAEAARLAWCYGDPGIAFALLRAGQAADRSDWIAVALEIARRAALREPSTTGASDPALCHGSAGLMHMFNRLFQETGESLFFHAARRWFEVTLSMRRLGSGLAGFTSISELDESGRPIAVVDPGLLTGAAGIGLSLLAACSDVPPEWDSCLLLSSPTPSLR